VSAPIRYVVGFLFDGPAKYVALIRKQKPAWQAGKLNGIGGKIEPGETPLQAMEREFAEEAGVADLRWQATAVIQGGSFELHVFHAFDGRILSARTMEDELVEIHPVQVLLGRRDLMPNLMALIALALDDSGITKPVRLMDERPQPGPKATLGETHGEC